MKVSVLGCGRWGSLIAWYLDSIGHEVALYGRETSKHMQRFLETRENDLLKMPESVALTTNLPEALKAETVVISIGAQGLRALCREMVAAGFAGGRVVLCMKGLEVGTGKRLSVVAKEELGEDTAVAVWLGPGHVQEFYNGRPSCMVIDSEDEAFKRSLVDAFSGPLIRFYYGTDLIGNEIGGAAKNVIGIAAGMLDGRGLGTLKGALMARAAREIARLIKAMGGNELSAYGLCHLGDYEATLFSPHSHNRRYGEAFAKGEPFESLAEGVPTAKAIVELARANGVELPICEAVYAMLYENADPAKALEDLLARSLKTEF